MDGKIPTCKIGTWGTQTKSKPDPNRPVVCERAAAGALRFGLSCGWQDAGQAEVDGLRAVVIVPAVA